MLATCSYHEFDPRMGVPVRVSLGTPRWSVPYEHDWSQSWVWEITPRKDYLYASDAVYERRFYAQLEAAGVDLLRAKFDTLERRTGGGTLVLLCFENLRVKGWRGCHRRDFANWWTARTGEDVPEFGKTPDRPHVHIPGVPPPEPDPWENPLTLF